MVWALAVIVLLGVGVPAGAWSYTRLRPPPPPSRLGTGYDRIDRWLLRQHGLPPLERERVRAAVFHGRQVGDPVLEPAAHDLAAKVLAREFGALRLSAVVRWVNVTMAVGFAAVGIGLLIVSPHAGMRALGALGLLDSAILTFVSVSSARQSQRIHRNAVMALKLNQDHR